jgi:glycosyltransferase involved in cell wall biosynthesis
VPSEPPPLRVGIDARCLNTRHPRGMGKYVTEVISHIGRTENLSWRLFSDRPEEVFHKPKGIDGEIDLFDMKGYRFHTWEQIGLPWRAWRTGIQVLHCTATTLPYWQPIPTVVTLHDILPWKRPIGDRYERWYRNSLVPAAFSRCAAVITISESSRQDILGLWPWLEHKLHVIPHGVSDIYQSAEKFSLSAQLEASLGGGSYFLYVGGAIERKRFAWAAEVFERLDSGNLKLAVCGFGDEEREKAQKALRPELRTRVCFLPYVNEIDMPGLYQHAVGVLYPTLYEGFGLPALEAQAVGTPVLFSDLSSLKELKGPGAVVLPVDELDAWVQTCNHLLAEPAATRNPDNAARSWALQFSWEASANRHLAIYRDAAAPGKNHA